MQSFGASRCDRIGCFPKRRVGDPTCPELRRQARNLQCAERRINDLRIGLGKSIGRGAAGVRPLLPRGLLDYHDIGKAYDR